MTPRVRSFASGRAGAGFSLIELISILALLGVLAAVVLPRFADTRSYQDLQLRDQLLSLARFAQQAALSRHNQTVALVLGRSGDWDFSVRVDTDGDGALDLVARRLEIARGASTLALVAPQGISVNGPDALVIHYDNLGNLSRLNGVPLAANLALDAAGRPLCLSLAGFAYAAPSHAHCSNH